jgi:hypothetical protein
VQIFLLVPPTTAVVESGFSILNNIKNEQRNRLSSKTLNYIMMIKINSCESLTDDMIQQMAERWLYNKKRRNISEVLEILGLKKSKWIEKVKTSSSESEDDTNDNYSVSALYLLSEIEKNDISENKEKDDQECSESESSEEIHSAPVKTRRKKKSDPEVEWYNELQFIQGMKDKKRRMMNDDKK